MFDLPNESVHDEIPPLTSEEQAIRNGRIDLFLFVALFSSGTLSVKTDSPTVFVGPGLFFTFLCEVLKKNKESTPQGLLKFCKNLCSTKGSLMIELIIAVCGFLLLWETNPKQSSALLVSALFASIFFIVRSSLVEGFVYY
jgi:hypothetical protein